MSYSNEPVAWMLVDEINGDYMLERHPSGDYDWIPLYTHPVKEQEPDLYSEDGFPLWTSPQFKELTDEEINDIAQQCWVYPEREQAIFNQHKFAKAILRKAQEK